MRKAIIWVGVVIIIAAGFVAWTVMQKNDKPPKSQSPAVVKDAVDVALGNMTLRDKVASLFVLHAPGTDANTLRQFTDQYHPAGVILMGDNIPTGDDALRAENDALRGVDTKFPRLVAVDQEGGTVKRLQGDHYPDAETLKTLPSQSTQNAFHDRSELVRSVGITLNFGIIADVTDDPDSFIYNRVLGTNPSSAAANVRAAVKGTRGSTLATLKHFPGHGETAADSHMSIPTTNLSYDTWRQKDALPFETGVQENADMIMFGHLRYSAVDSAPASLSKKWHDILKNDLKFLGVTVTDDMCMLQASGEPAFSDPVANAVNALQAGNTLLLYVLNNNGSDTSMIDPNILIDGVLSAVENGKIDRSVIDNDARQILALRAHAAAFVQN
jgi:beta-N-acetylhexosaminidase